MESEDRYVPLMALLGRPVGDVRDLVQPGGGAGDWEYGSMRCGNGHLLFNTEHGRGCTKPGCAYRIVKYTKPVRKPVPVQKKVEIPKDKKK